MIRTLYRNSKGNVTFDVPETHWRAAMLDQGGILWVDFQNETTERAEPILRDLFRFHPLAIEDALREAHVPKVDSWGEYLYAVFHSVAFDPDTLDLNTNELDVFLGSSYLVTSHRNGHEVLDRIWSAARRDSRVVSRGGDYLLFQILDMIAADFLPAIDALDETLDRLEDEIFARPTTQTLNTLFQVKRAILNLRRIIGPQREALNRLARDPYPAIGPEDRVYFRDVYDHFVRLMDINESLRDLVSGSLDTYLSVSSNRINEVMKVLTVFTALFMPLTFITGFFGMNFEFLPFANTPVFWLSIGGMLLLPVIMLYWLRKRGWL